MSSRAMAWAWSQEIKSGPKFVLIALADRADESGICWPGLNWIHAKTGMSVGAVSDNINRLKKIKLLKVVNRKRNDGSKTSNLYSLCIPNTFALSAKQKKYNDTADIEFEGILSEPDGPPTESVVGIAEYHGHNTSKYTSNYTSNKKEKNIIPKNIIPAWLPKDEWQEYLLHRKRRKAPITDNIAKRLFRTLEQLKNLGHDPASVLTEAIDRNWIGIKVEWIHKERNGQRNAAEERDYRYDHDGFVG